MQAPAPTPCPHCGTLKPARLWLCHPCWQEVPWSMKVDLWDAISKRRDELVTLHERNILNYLNQYSSAV